MSKSSTKKVSVDPSQKKGLLAQASVTITAFAKGLVEFEPGTLIDDDDEYGFTFFEGYIVYFTKSYIEAKADFIRSAARILKARSAHEPTISTLIQKAAQGYVIARSEDGGDDPDGAILVKSAQSLVDVVLEDLSKIYTRIE